MAKILSGEFYCPTHLLQKQINVVVAGCGATGGEVIDKLIRLHYGLIKCGHPSGLMVHVFDADDVSDTNIGRQRFSPMDIGYNKAKLLIHRANLAYGLNWESHEQFYSSEPIFDKTDLLITCVDKASVRVGIAESILDSYEDLEDFGSKMPLWLDFGNSQFTGQFILGHAFGDPNAGYLPNVYSLFPELKNVNDDDEPSCSFPESIRNQDLLVNATLADHGINCLWQLLRQGKLTHHGAFINNRKGQVKPLPIRPETWFFMNKNLKAKQLEAA